MRNITFLKLMLLAVVMVGSVSVITAQTEVTYTFSEKGFTNAQTITSGSIDANLDYLAEKNSSSNAPTYYSSGTSARFYASTADGNGCSYQITAKNGAKINSIEIYGVTSYVPTVKYNVDGGADAAASLSGTTYSITGLSATTLKFRNAITGGTTQLRITGYKVTYTLNTTAPSIVVSPTSLSFGNSNLNVTAASQNVTVTGANLTVAPGYSVDNTNFAVSGTLTATGGTLSVTFTPTTAGALTGTLTITGDGVTKAVALTGTGVDPTNPYNLDDSSPLSSLNETFEAGSLPSTWTNVAVQGDKTWVYKTFNSNSYAQMSSFGGSGIYQTLLISPAVDFDKIDKTKVKFDWNSGYTKSGTTLKVYVMSKDGTKTEVKSIDDNSNPTGYGAAFTTETLDLSSYTGVKFLAFEYNGDAASTTTTYQVDNINAVTTTPTSVSTTRIDAGAYASNGKVMFNAAAGETVEIFNIAGQKVISRLAADGLNSIDVQAKGVMIVKVGNRVGKVIL